MDLSNKTKSTYFYVYTGLTVLSRGMDPPIWLLGLLAPGKYASELKRH